tara:strand:+ start:238 stop:600 length:363 start_codon:yes stop_codon:yes gene_type:complete
MKAAEVFVFASIFSAYNRLMKNQSIKTLALLGGLLLATIPAKAEDQAQQAQAVFWYAYNVGAGTALCMAAESGRVSKDYPAEYMQAFYVDAEADPDLLPFKESFNKASRELKKLWPDCYE